MSSLWRCWATAPPWTPPEWCPETSRASITWRCTRRRTSKRSIRCRVGLGGYRPAPAPRVLGTDCSPAGPPSTETDLWRGGSFFPFVNSLIRTWHRLAEDRLDQIYSLKKYFISFSLSFFTSTQYIEGRDYVFIFSFFYLFWIWVFFYLFIMVWYSKQKFDMSYINKNLLFIVLHLIIYLYYLKLI